MKPSLISLPVLRLFLAILIGGGLVLSPGCAVSESSIEDVGTQFQDGLQGRGRIIPNDPTSDAFGPVYQ